jgi:nitroreductase
MSWPVQNVSQAQALRKTDRRLQYDINPLLLHRWSPRAMSGEEISDTELMRLFEAARCTPSSYNGQPWRFIYAKRNSEQWDKLFNLMALDLSLRINNRAQS